MKNSAYDCNEKFFSVNVCYQITVIFLLCCLLSFATTQNSYSVYGKSAYSAEQSTSSATSGTLSGTCANAYYPVSASVKREYRVTYENKVLKPATYTETFVDITPDSFKVKTTFAESGSGVTNSWKCSGDGLTALEYANVNMANQNPEIMQLDVQTVSTRGIAIPSENNWKAGYKWNLEYETAGKMEGKGSIPSGELKSNVTMENEILGQASVTVPAGTFSALKVKSKIIQKGTMQMATEPVTNVPVNISLEAIMYYAKGVGLVKSTVEKIALSELLSYSK